MNDPNELTPAERRAFDALSRERPPRAELEDRVVAALQRRGLLPIPLAQAAGPRRRLTPWLVGAIAASLALFVGGFAAGQYVGSRSGAAAALSGVQASRGDVAEVAAHAERAGAMYVAALAALSRLSDTADAPTRATARQVAITALGTVASEVAHLAPDDPLAAAVLRGLDERAQGQRPASSTRSVVWF
jgi:ABC-type transporter Mla subunit MlaD